MSFFILCPFHNEKTPSLCVNNKKKCFHCFGCGASGSIFYLYKLSKNFEFRKSFLKFNTNNDNNISNISKVLISDDFKFKVLNINKFINKILFINFNIRKRIFLKKKQYKNKTINKFELGFLSNNFLSYISLNYSKEILFNTGILDLKKKKNFYKNFFNRIIFPIKNLNGYILGYAGRNIYDKSPKYINSYETFFFKKGENLYGLYECKKYIIKKDYVILVEGYFDVLSLYQYNIKNILGLMGSNIFYSQLEKILNFTKNIFICFDGDSPGFLAMKKSINFFINCNIFLSLKYIILPRGFDPDSFINKFGKNKFIKKIKNSLNIYYLVYLLYIKNLFFNKKIIKNNFLKFRIFFKKIYKSVFIEKFLSLILYNKDINLRHFFYIIDSIYIKIKTKKYFFKKEFFIYEKLLIVLTIYPQIIYFFEKKELFFFLKSFPIFYFMFLELFKKLRKDLNFLKFFISIKLEKNYIYFKSIFMKYFYKKKLRYIYFLKNKYIIYIKKLNEIDLIFYKKNILNLINLLFNFI